MPENASRYDTERQVIANIIDYANRGAALRQSFFQKEASRIHAAGLLFATTFTKGGKILLCGNGGSAADCQHLAAEFVNRFVLDRPPLPAIALTTDTSALTAIGNDFSFNELFSKQVQALGRKGDILVAISTSGNSENVIQAVKAARQTKVFTIGFTGKNGGAMRSLCDMCFVVEEKETALVQEVHIALGHLLCALTDYYLFENVTELTPYIQGEKPLAL